MEPEALLEAAGLPVTERPRRLSGGDMGEVWAVGRFVVKTHPRPPRGLFPAEARGLARLGMAGVRVPAVHFVSEAGLVMDHLGTGPVDMAALGRQVAALHGAGAERYGNEEPVFLGRFGFPAGTSDDWREVFVDRRLRPLLAACRRTLGADAAVVEHALDAIPARVEGPTVVHGDLWSGNVHFGAEGPALIDPGCYAGERVVDLSMMQLFGGVDHRFWEAYEAVLPVPEAVRRQIPGHQLCFLLVHVHFFGAGYAAGTVAAARAALEAG